MRTITRLGPVGHAGGRSPLCDMIDHARRALSAAWAGRRPLRPLQGIDLWSDQAEVAYYEALCAGR